MSTEAGEAVSPYDGMAPVYDRLFDGELNGRVEETALVAGLCSTFGRDVTSMLDLGSGTGTVFAQLSKVMRLDKMVGIEQSAKMIEVARRNVPEAEFIQGDITDFELGRQFDVVTCLFDTINHIRSAAGWEKTFERAATHLKPGGIFIFDMVTERLLKDITEMESYDWKFDGGKCSFDMQSIGNNQYKGNFKIIPTDEQETMTELSIVETSFPIVPVLRSLKKVLVPKTVFDHGAALEFEGDSTPRVTNRTTRIMVLAEKAIEDPAVSFKD